ncbi:MAG: response regulator [bacterium]|nr:response regulator [Candidatus Sumerlaeota bacterium]
MTTDTFRIMAIDDDKDILDLISIMLAQHYEVLTVGDPMNACDLLDIFEPDLVILDIMMPKVTGYQIIEFIKQNPRHSHVLVIFLSAKDTSRDMKYGYKLGANLYLPKPFQPERLLKNVQSLLDQNPGMKPHKKTYSMRDVSLRVSLKIGTHPSGIPTAPAPGDHSTIESAHTSTLRLKRPLGQEATEADQKKWMG